MLRLMGEVAPGAVLVSIGEENAHEGFTGASVVSVGYGSAGGTADLALGGLGVVGPTRMDYPGPWPRYEPWPATSASCWPRAEDREEVATDYYGVLGLSQGATDKEIKTAYRRKARDLHPDVNPDPGAKEEFQQVSRAYEALTDPDKRRIVDLGGDPFETGGGGGGGNPFGGAGFGGLGDIMDAFFGGGTATRGPRSRTRAGGDALIRVELDLAETVFGTTTDITVDTAVLCSLCTGAGTAPGTHPRSAPPATAAARCRACSAPSSARSSPPGPAPRAGAPARSSRSPARSAPATAGCGPAAPSRSRSRPASRTACGSG